MMSKDSMNGKDVPKRIEEVKNWDSITISLLVLAGILFVFSFFAPALFVKTASNPNLDFSKTGEIGDTIGGIMNPFIALVAVVLTFLAFYMQIKANQIQRKIFYDGVKEEKAKVLREQRFDWYYKLSLLQIDLENIIVDVNTKSEELKKYFEIEKKYPFRTNFLFRTPLRNYSIIL